MGGTDALRRSLGLTGYTRKGMGSSAVKALQQADKTLPSNLDNVELEDMADNARQSAEQVFFIYLFIIFPKITETTHNKNTSYTRFMCNKYNQMKAEIRGRQ